MRFGPIPLPRLWRKARSDRRLAAKDERLGASGVQLAAKGICFGAALLVHASCATLQGPDYGVYDENPGFNRASYEFSEVVDRRALVPIARGYQDIAPDLVETGISNFFANLASLDSSANGFLQGKPKRGATDSLRFIINTTLGLGGLFDVATPAGLHSQQEDFGQTLAVWGWKKSRYVYVPLLGPSTLRDLSMLVIRGWLPRLALGDLHHLSISALGVVSARADALALTEARDAAALDAYVFTREAYMQRRKFLIFDGDPPLDDFDDFFDEFDEGDARYEDGGIEAGE